MHSSVTYCTRRLADEAACDLRFARIATLVRRHGVDPATAVIADFFRDDHCCDFCLLVTPSGRVFAFDYDWRGRSEAEGDLSEWEEVTDGWEHGIYAAEIALGFQIAGSTG